MSADSQASPAEPVSPSGSDRPVDPAFAGALLVTFMSIGLWIYLPALEGPFISDDLHYVKDNPYVKEVNLENLLLLLDPFSPVVPHVDNYAPVHLIGHLIEWQMFGPDTLGYHVVNLVLHVLASLMVVLLLIRSGVTRTGAVVGGLVLVAHPANVEAVAWISQLKSPLALVLAVGALLAHPKRPLLGAALFTMALFAKPMAWLALPVAITWGWLLGSQGQTKERGDLWHWRWLGLWAAAFAAFSAVELSAYSNWVMPDQVSHDDPWTALRSSVVVAGRYLLMSLVGWGTSTFHDPPPYATSWLDPRWLTSLGVLWFIGWRIVSSLRARRLEFAWWIWAGAAYAPFCGIIPLPHVIADRYLYFVLPGLVGACLLAAQSTAAKGFLFLEARGFDAKRAISGGATLGVLLLVFTMATQAKERAGIWTSEDEVMADAIANYPNGKVAMHEMKVSYLKRATAAAVGGNTTVAVEVLRALHLRDFDAIDMMLFFPPFIPLLEDPEYRQLLREVAAGLLEKYRGKTRLSQPQLHKLGLAYFVSGDLKAAEHFLEKALEAGGTGDSEVQNSLLTVRAQLFGRRGDAS